MHKYLFATLAISAALPINAMAGAIFPVPLPIAGSFAGPIGLGITAIAYCGYRVYKHKK